MADVSVGSCVSPALDLVLFLVWAKGVQHRIYQGTVDLGFEIFAFHANGNCHRPAYWFEPQGEVAGVSKIWCMDQRTFASTDIANRSCSGNSALRFGKPGKCSAPGPECGNACVIPTAWNLCSTSLTREPHLSVLTG